MRTQKLVTPLVLHALKYFDAAARNLSFTRAAAELHGAPLYHKDTFNRLELNGYLGIVSE